MYSCPCIFYGRHIVTNFNPTPPPPHIAAAFSLYSRSADIRSYIRGSDSNILYCIPCVWRHRALWQHIQTHCNVFKRIRRSAWLPLSRCARACTLSGRPRTRMRTASIWTRLHWHARARASAWPPFARTCLRGRCCCRTSLTPRGRTADLSWRAWWRSWWRLFVGMK